MDNPLIRISWGELLDRLTILEIKDANAKSTPAKEAITRQLAELKPFEARVGGVAALKSLKDQLAAVNRQLWDIEDELRVMENRQQFDARFVELARCVYKTNDERARLKRAIDALLDSDLAEVKIYQGSETA